MHVVAKRVSKAITSIYIELIDYRATDNKATFRFRNKQTSKKKNTKAWKKSTGTQKQQQQLAALLKTMKQYAMLSCLNSNSTTGARHATELNPKPQM